MKNRPPARVLGVALLVLGCAPAEQPVPPPSQSAGPVGAVAYREILRAQAGLDLGPAALAALAAEDAAWIEARMDELAAEIAGRSSSWPEVFEPLRSDHPPDADGVLALYRRETARARAFVVERELVSLPPRGSEPGDDRFEVVRTPDSIPEGRYTFVGYLGHRMAVTVGEGSRLRDHCRVCVPPLTVHEGYPGHHAAFLSQRSGSLLDDPGAAARAERHLKNPFFHEGWGQYAEWLMLEEGYYDGDPGRELGAWRNLLFRAVRARVDALLHAGEMTEGEARAALTPFLDRETAAEEVARHRAAPGAKAAYHVGLLQVLALRDRVREAEGDAFDLRAFHDRLIRLPGPIPALARERFEVEIPAGLVPLAERHSR